jgi:copper chaperone CopZ
MRKLLWILAPLALAQAEFLQVAMDVDKMDCATCVKSLEMGLKKIKGVQSVSIDPATGATFDLVPGNKITLELLRDKIKGVGFRPGDATVIVRGKPVTQDGRWRFEIDGIGKIFNLATRHDHILLALQDKSGAVLTLKAISPVPPDPQTTPLLDVTAIVP